MRYPIAAGAAVSTVEVLPEDLREALTTVNSRVLVDQALGDGSIRIDTPIAQERPIPPNIFERLQVDIADQDLLPVVRAFGEHAPERITKKRSAPELEPLAKRRLAPNVASFEANAIHDRHINAVRDRVSPLDRPPGIVLGHAELRLLCRMPSNCRRIEEYLRSLQCRQPCSLRIPLIPADQRPDSPRTGVERAESQVPGSEVELFVIQRIVRNVHLAVQPAQRAVAVEDRRGIVVDASGPFLKQGCDQNHPIVSRRGR